MKADIHPNYTEMTVSCSCGHKFTTKSTAGRDIHVDICSKCHPFFTGQQKMVDTGGRIDKFNQKYAKRTSQQKGDEK